MNTDSTADRLLSLPEVARFLGVPLHTLYGWRSRGEAPPGIKVGRHVRVRRAALDAWLDAHADPEPTGGAA